MAELKEVFDRFAVDGLITAPEACQALTEGGVFAPRRFDCSLNYLLSLLLIFGMIVLGIWHSTFVQESMSG